MWEGKTGGRGPAAEAVSQPSSPLNLAGGGGGGPWGEGRVCTCTSVCKPAVLSSCLSFSRPSALAQESRGPSPEPKAEELFPATQMLGLL